jgi:hypothetical protein
MSGKSLGLTVARSLGLCCLALTAASGQAAAAERTLSGFSEDLTNFLGTPPVGGPATITIERDRRGHVSNIVISDTTGTVETGRANAARGFVADPLTRFTFPPQGWAIASRLHYSTFGAWIESGANSGTGTPTAGVAVAGRPTPPSAVPQTGTATYQGKTFGVGSVGGPMLQLPLFVWGDATLQANFAQHQMTASFTNMMVASTALGTGVNPVGPGRPFGDFGGTATLNGNVYAGPLSGQLNNPGHVPNTINGTGAVQGVLFGPRAQETGGTWSLGGSTAPGGQGVPGAISATGSFGATRR